MIATKSATEQFKADWDFCQVTLGSTSSGAKMKMVTQKDVVHFLTWGRAGTTIGKETSGISPGYQQSGMETSQTLLRRAALDNASSRWDQKNTFLSEDLLWVKETYFGFRIFLKPMRMAQSRFTKQFGISPRTTKSGWIVLLTFGKKWSWMDTMPAS